MERTATNVGEESDGMDNEKDERTKGFKVSVKDDRAGIL